MFIIGTLVIGLTFSINADANVRVLAVDLQIGGDAPEIVEDGFTCWQIEDYKTNSVARDFGSVRITISSGAVKENPWLQLRSTDRATSTGDRPKLERDYIGVEAGAEVGQVAVNYVDISLANLKSGGRYTFKSFHRDAAAENYHRGVVDVAYSLDGGKTWVNAVDNAEYGQKLYMFQQSFTAANETVVFRYMAGGGLFGDNGVPRTDMTNRQFPINGFELEIAEN